MPGLEVQDRETGPNLNISGIRLPFASADTQIRLLRAMGVLAGPSRGFDGYLGATSGFSLAARMHSVMSMDTLACNKGIRDITYFAIFNHHLQLG